MTHLPVDDILETGSITLEYNAYEYTDKYFGPLTLPIALMRPSLTPSYVGLLQKIVDSSMPLTLLAVTLPVLAAAMAVILDGSRIMFHISIFAFIKGLQALNSYSINTFDGKSLLLFGARISPSQLRALAIVVIIAALFWQIRVISELIAEPSSRLSKSKSRYLFATFCAFVLLCSSTLFLTTRLFYL